MTYGLAACNKISHNLLKWIIIIRDQYGIGLAVGSLCSLALVFSVFAPTKTGEVVDAVFGLNDPAEVSVKASGKTTACVKSDHKTDDVTVVVDGQAYSCPNF